MSKVLVVDDEADMRWLLVGVLRDNGLEVLAAEDGRTALEQFHRESPDVVLLDIKMPGLDGIQTLELIKTMASQVPVIMITAYGDVPSAVASMKRGAYDYLIKPFDNDEVLLSVLRALEKREQEDVRLREVKRTTIRELARALDHEICNPLAIIDGNAQLLLEEVEAGARMVEAIREGSRRIVEVIRKLCAITEPVTTLVPWVGPMLDLGGSTVAGTEGIREAHSVQRETD